MVELFKNSYTRFGRNAADVLSALQVMQDYGVNLICVEDGIDSSKDAGKLMISVLSAVAEIERENIRVQMEFIVFDNTSRENELRVKNWDANLQKAYEMGKGFFG